MTSLSETIQNLPFAGLIPVVLLALVGILLWAAGRRVLRAGFAAVGLILGAGIGWVLGEQASLGVPPWVPALVIGIIIACVAALGYRVAIAGALALVFGVGGATGVVMVAELQGVEKSIAVKEPKPIETEQKSDKFDELFPSSFAPGDQPLSGGEGDASSEGSEGDREAASGEEGEPEAGGDLRGQAAEVMDDVRTYAGQLIGAIKQKWSETPEQLRPSIVSAAIIGLLAGALIGTLAPTQSATVVTAFGGSLLWLSCLRVMLAQFGAGVEKVLPSSATALLIVWLIIAIAGAVIQWIFRPKRADKAD
jgi:hypothetical protein